jgi:ABC-type sugar transport system ATPase subunit
MSQQIVGARISTKGIRKSFPGVLALDGVDFDAKPGRVHAVVGENGAGKSTLMKLLGGLYRPDAGKVLIDDTPVELRSPNHALLAGICVIHQELDLAPHLTAAENLHLGREPKRMRIFTDKAAMTLAATTLFADMETPIPVDVPVGHLSLALQQMVEIGKAVSRQARIIIMDEPTSSLADHEVEVLYRLIRRLRDRGTTIIYISHRMKEIFDLSNDLTVMRDGRIVGGGEIKKFSRAEIVRLMVGRDIDESRRRGDEPHQDTVLSVDKLNAPEFHDISFSLRRGELLGIGGLAGCGRESLLRALYGLSPTTSGTIQLDGKVITLESPSAAIRNGIAYLSEDRRHEGIFTQMGVRDNVTISVLHRLALPIVGLLPLVAEDREMARHEQGMSIRYAAPHQPIGQLSGGNQQKVLLARALATDCRVLILSEPTRGVDIGAKEEIYRLLEQLNAKGVSILVVSSDLPELLQICHRCLVMFQGRVTGEISRHEMSEEAIMHLATGAGHEAAS